MKFIVALLALVAVAAAAPSAVHPLINLSSVDLNAMFKLHPELERGFFESMVNVLCAIVCDAIYITLELLLNLTLQVIMSACKFLFSHNNKIKRFYSKNRFQLN